HYYIKCKNKSVTADAINKQVWSIIDTICKNIHVIEELGSRIKLSASEPNKCQVEQLEAKEGLLNKNLEKQKGLYEIYAEDKINLGIYKERAELLRNEEKKIKSDIKAIQLSILESKNSINMTRATQDFLLRLKSIPKKEQSDYALKMFMRIIFKGIYVQNQEIVKVELNQPWKMCYEEGLKCLKTEKIGEKSPQKAKRSYVFFCVPSAVR
ncbi:MAG: hypothetical protein JW869_02665, partial [Candidatus Omnitrophica bacterium]|nr:hypothetical protein [Candidatus Omnitrophota bacterium]